MCLPWASPILHLKRSMLASWQEKEREQERMWERRQIFLLD
jgi:hypothetical protein